MTSLRTAANRSLAFPLFPSGDEDCGGEGECLEDGSISRLSRITMKAILSREEANGRMQRTHVRCLEHVEPATAALDDMDFVFANNNVDATEDTTIPELVKSVSEGAGVDSGSNTNCDNGGCTPCPDDLCSSRSN